jgi:hypothetical protein
MICNSGKGNNESHQESGLIFLQVMWTENDPKKVKAACVALPVKLTGSSLLTPQATH